MIERINLIENDPYKFSYEKLTRFVVFVVIGCVLLYATLVIRINLAERKIDSVNAEIAFLKDEFNRLLKAAPPKADTGPNSELTNVFSQTPHWAPLIRDVGNRLPGNAWLTSLKGVSPYSIPSGKKDKEKEKEKGKNKESNTPTAPPKGLTLKGTAQNLTDVALFVERLHQSPYITRASLSSSIKEGTAFNFTIDCDIMAGQK